MRDIGGLGEKLVGLDQQKVDQRAGPNSMRGVLLGWGKTRGVQEVGGGFCADGAGVFL